MTNEQLKKGNKITKRIEYLEEQLGKWIVKKLKQEI